MENADWGLDPQEWEPVSMPAPAPTPVSTGVETTPYVPALAETRKEKIMAIAAAMMVGLMLGYCILH